jgi:transketolase
LRKVFVETLCELAESDERILLLTGDLGYMALEPFRERFPARFFNVGVAEQNMIAVATGLAESGFFPYAYSIATFATLRALEFIRNGPVLQRLPVRIVGMGAGFCYGSAGPTHYGIEDVAVMRALPGLTVIVPADSAQTGSAIRLTANYPGPVYYSLSKDDRAFVPGLAGRFELGRVQTIGHGRDLAMVAMGAIASEAVRTAEVLASRHDVQATVIVVSSFCPDPAEDLLRLLRDFPAVIGLEAQVVSGGLNAFLGSLIASNGLSCLLIPLGIRSALSGRSGSQQNRWQTHGIDRESIIKAALAQRVVTAR